MKKIYVKDVVEKCNAQLLVGNRDQECQFFCKDTRTIKENDVYIGIQGETFDGNSFYSEAFDKGASICILDNIENVDLIKYQNKTILYVENTIKAIQQLAIYKRSLYNIPVIAITGSVGKTSTKDIIASVLNEKYKVLKTSGNYNNHIGVPLTILSLTDEDILVVEMGMNNKGELSVLTNIAKPTIAVITNVGTAHIGNLGSRENILKAKLEILEGLDENGTLLINNDNDLLHQVREKLKDKYDILTIGIDNSSDYMALNIENHGFSSKFYIENNKIDLSIGGEPFIYNSLMAYAIGKKFKLEPNQIIIGIEKFRSSSNRMNIIKNQNGITIIDDTYNANYDSMKAAIEMLGKSEGRKIAVLADMLELGEYATNIHQSIGKEISKNKIDILITIGDLAKEIGTEAMSNGINSSNVYICQNIEKTIEILEEILKKGDIVLLKGSHSMNLSKIVDKIVNFY